MSADEETAGALRRGLLAVFVFGMLVSGSELLLLGHIEDEWQWTPLVLLGTSLAVLGWHGFSRGAGALRAHRVLMALFIGSGLGGVRLHYRSNVEFELEMYPSLGGLELFQAAMTGAMPVLAPLAMAGLGFLGLAYAYRHPADAETLGSAPDRGER